MNFTFSAGGPNDDHRDESPRVNLGDLAAGAGLFEAFDSIRKTFAPGFTPFGGPGGHGPHGRPGGRRRGRGDVRAAILVLLQEEPKHGYQLIADITERSGGAWRPSPGSVYPTLQLLTDEGLVRVEETGDRKTYSLTETGLEVAADAAESTPPWEQQASARDARFDGALPKASVKLAQAVAQVSTAGSAEQIEKATEIIDDARRRVYALLAED